MSADDLTPDLYRARDAGALLRADDDESGSVLHGHFSVFDTWYRIQSWYEGTFLERVAKGSFRKTMKDQRDRLVVSFDHGFDPQMGDKPLGPITALREDDIGAYYEVPLLDTDYNRDFILPALQGRTIDGRTLGSVLGASFMFAVVRDEWNKAPAKSDHNPDGVPERTIREVKLFEFGPVAYPASPAATAGVRSLTDHYFERKLARDPDRAQRAVNALQQIASPAASGTSETEPSAPPPLAPRGITLTQLRALKVRASA